MKKTAFAALFGSLLLAGCLSVPQPTVLHMSELRNKDFGRYPGNYQQIIRRHLAQNLIDPESARIGSFTPPRKYLRIDETRLTASGLDFRAYYAACVRVNSKNRYGGYTGWQEHVYFIRNGEIMLGGDPFHVKCGSTEDFILSVSPLANVKIEP
ncbi:hypothetical protein H9Q10_04070 [Eikenella sp. S3360]|uniref:Lipoprotein n=1 Tax=Eikenella glucosivorans TaxID=2766967 RepID=A0ABS0N968_9NEIS|nr:hypothetical protein [Eikenella glucosivorans]MBH5328842.1 hypothetical protein [Eikenella glucosivorans]